MMTKQQWIEKIQENDAFAEHVYNAIVNASTTDDAEEKADALASALQTYYFTNK